MPYLRPALSRRLTRRTCLKCGHHGPLLQGAVGLTTRVCPGCGADLCARPPRSYAEMEGLVEVSGAHQRWTKRRPSAPTASTPAVDTRDPRPAAGRAVIVLMLAVACVAAAFLVF